MLHTVLAARPVPTTADWWMVGLTAAAAVGTVGALFAVLAANRHARTATTTQLEAQRQELELTRQALDDERRARQEEIARLDAQRIEAEVAQARLVHAGAAQPVASPTDDGPDSMALGFPVHNDSDKTVLDVSGTLYVSDDGGPLRPVQYDPRQWRLRRVPSQDIAMLIFGAYPHAHARFDVELEFTDAAGLRWGRRGIGQPRQILGGSAADPGPAQ